MRKLWIPAALLVVLGVVCARLALSGSLLGPIAAGVVALLPIVAYFSITRPLVLPYAAYVLLLPFDNVLAISSGTTLTKFMGLASTGAILLWALGRRKFTPPSITLFLGASLMIWIGLSALWALDVKVSLHILPTYVGLFMLYIVLSIAPVERRDFIILLAATVVGSLGASVYGIYFFHNQSVADAQALADNAGRLMVHIGDNTIDPNAYSDAILMPFCLLLMIALRTRSAFHKLGASVGLATLLGAVYVSASRGAVLAIGSALLYLVVRSRYRLQILAVAAIPAALITVMLALGQSSVLIDRFSDNSHPGGPRAGVWSVGFEAFREHWLTGVGVGNYTQIYNSVFIHVYQAYSAGWDRASHNLLVQVSSELGIVGVVLLLAFWISNLFLLRQIRPEDEWYDFRLAFEAAVVGLFVAALTVDLFASKYTWLLFALLAQLRTLTLSSPVPIPKRAVVMPDFVVGAPPARRDFQPRRA